MEKMRFEEFVNAVVDKIKAYLPESFASANVELTTVTKNNDLKLTGLTIRSAENNISPTIYLEPFFDRYMDGVDMSEVLESIADVRIQHEVHDTFDTEQIMNFDRVKEMIVPKLINRKWNEQLLSERPHTDVCDLAVTYHILLDQDFGGSASVAVTNQLMHTWKTDVETLHELALRNMTKKNPSTFQSLGTIIGSMLGDDAEMPEQVQDCMFVLMNSSRINGASAVLDQAVMKMITERIGTRFYLLPSSIHEWIIVRGDENTDTSMLAQMVRDVNAGELAPDERLSDHAYLWKSDEGLISV